MPSNQQPMCYWCFSHSGPEVYLVVLQGNIHLSAPSTPRSNADQSLFYQVQILKGYISFQDSCVVSSAHIQVMRLCEGQPRNKLPAITNERAQSFESSTSYLRQKFDTMFSVWQILFLWKIVAGYTILKYKMWQVYSKRI